MCTYLWCRGQFNANTNAMPPRQNEYVREFVKNIFDAHLRQGKQVFLNNNQPAMQGQCQRNATRAEGLCERIFYAHRQGNKQKNKQQQSTCDAGQCNATHMPEKFFITYLMRTYQQGKQIKNKQQQSTCNVGRVKCQRNATPGWTSGWTSMWEIVCLKCLMCTYRHDDCQPAASAGPLQLPGPMGGREAKINCKK